MSCQRLIWCLCFGNVLVSLAGCQVKGKQHDLDGGGGHADVAAAVEAQTNIVLDRKKLHVDHIKTTGTYQVAAKLHHDVEFPTTVEVVAK